MLKENVQKNVNIKNQGSGNGRWNGGENSYYTNHYQLKLNRRERLKQCGNKCEDCGRDNTTLKATKIDCDKNNHEISNLKMLCSVCSGNKQNSKFKKIYGSTLSELCKEFGISFTTIYKLMPGCKTKSQIRKALTKYAKNRNSKPL